MNKDALLVKNISKSFLGPEEKNFTAIDEISFAVKQGEILSILGPSGCGKTTLLCLIANLKSPTKGLVIFPRGNLKKKVSFIFQIPSLLPWRNVEKNISLPIEINNNKREETSDKKLLDEYIDLVSLNEFKYFLPSQLSAGMQQRVALARALITEPDIILMDEPFSALDAINRDKMNRELLKIHRKKKPTIICATHSIDEAIMISDKIIVLSKNPATVKEIIEVGISQLREYNYKSHPNYLNLYNEIIRLLDN